MNWHLPGASPGRSAWIAVALIGLVLLFGAWQQASGVFTPLDQTIHRALAGVQSRPLTLVMVVLTRFGEESMLTIVAAVLYWYGRRAECAMLLLLLLFAGTGANDHMKSWFGLPRPLAWEAAQLDPDSGGGFGYPSGHTLTGVILAWLVYHLLGRAWVACLCIAPLMGLTRIYLGVHDFSDTVGGALHGLAWLYLASAGTQLLQALPSGWFDDAGLRRGFAAGGAVACVLYLFMDPVPASAVRFGPMLLGAGLGAALLPRAWVPKSLRHFLPMIALGMGLVLGVRVGLGRALPDMPLAHALRYGLLGLVLGLSPRLMIGLRLADYRDARRERRVVKPNPDTLVEN